MSEVLKPASAGTMESSDVLVELVPAEGRQIQLTSVVEAQFGDSIIATMTEVLESFGITDAFVDAVDRGALDWIIRARMQAACCRATGVAFDWKGEDQ